MAGTQISFKFHSVNGAVSMSLGEEWCKIKKSKNCKFCISVAERVKKGGKNSKKKKKIQKKFKKKIPNKEDPVPPLRLLSRGGEDARGFGERGMGKTENYVFLINSEINKKPQYPFTMAKKNG